MGGLAAFARLRAMPATPGCTLMAEQEEGPYYLDDQVLRRDITEGKPGLPLRLRVALVDARRCNPLPGAALDIWHCDALGVYSGFTAADSDGRGGRGRRGMGPSPPGFDGRGMGPPPRPRTTDASRFLRGVQVTGADGIAEFATVYPGWYAGRAIHIHLKVHTGGHVSHTGQLFLPEDTTDAVARLQPYAGRLNVPRTLQSQDGIFNSQHGAASMVNLARLGRADAEGFVATVTLAVDPEATPAPVGFGGRR